MSTFEKRKYLDAHRVVVRASDISIDVS